MTLEGSNNDSNGTGGSGLSGGGPEAGNAHGSIPAVAPTRSNLSEPGPDPQAVVRALGVLADRIGDLEDAVAEAAEELGKVRRTVSELKGSALTRKQLKKELKKVKKVLDQLEVVEVGPDGAPVESSGA